MRYIMLLNKRRNINLASTTHFNEKRVDSSNSLIPYVEERVLSVTASSPRKGMNADIIHKVF